MSGWPTHPDGRNKKIGEMTTEERRAAFKRAGDTLQAEFNDPNSTFRKTCEALLTGPETSTSQH